jgi:hypothetical protein
MADEHDEDVYIDLDKDERRLMVLALNEYSGLARRGSELLPPVVGTLNAEDWFTYYMRLLDTIKIEGPLTDLDWARALFLTEASFGSQLVGTGWEWEIGQSGAKDVLVLRSLQEKVSTDERSRLLQENVTFPTPVGERAERPPPVHSSACPIELDDDERRLMSTAIDAYTTSPRHGFGILAPIIGQRSFEAWSTYVAQLHRAVAGNEDLIDLDWMRALFLTEIGFASVLVGFGSQFKDVDQHAIGVLRSLQLTIDNADRQVLFSENATYPRIRYEGEHQ